MQVARWLHLLAVVVWIGGMFFAHVALRPALQSLEPGARLPLACNVLANFFRWVGIAVAVILASGAWMIVELGGFTAVGVDVHLMTALGVVMVAIFGAIVAGPYRRLVVAVAEGAWQPAGAAMARVRRYVAVNLVLGLVTITIAVLGHAF